MSHALRPLIVCLLATPGCALFKLANTTASFPHHEGELVVEGVRGDVTIARDGHGVPNITAGNEHDGWFGLGFAVGQDRLFQADLSRRLGEGRLSAWFGERTVDFDTFARSLELERHGEEAFAAAMPETREAWTAYISGLNAAAALQLPVEYRLLDVPFEPFDEADAAVIGSVQAWTLQGNLKQELLAIALADVDVAIVDRLTKSHANTPEIDWYWSELRKSGPYEFSPGFEAFTDVLGGRASDPEASNAWIVDGSKTATGLPIVANDPHLRQTVPSLWYLATVDAGDLHVAGAHIPGLPGFPVGHSDKLAWGLTNLMADVTDLAIVDRHGDEVWIAGNAEPVARRRLELDVEDRTQTVEVGTTSLGPIVGTTDTHALVLRWQALELVDHGPDQLYDLATIDTVEAVLPRLVGREMAVAQNLVVADTTGDWAWQAIGSVPHRKDHTGRVPYPASSAAHGWSGWLSDLPGRRRSDPGPPFVVTANNRPDHPSADAISTTFSPDQRFDRITELLEEADDIDLPELHAIQMDVRDNGAHRFLDTLLEGVQPTDAGRACHEVLTRWNRQSATDEVGPTVWALLQRSLVIEATDGILGPEQQHVALGVVSAGRHPINGDLTGLLGDRVRTVGRALDRACVEGRERYGDDVSTWTWGRAHTLALQHPFARQSKLLKGWNMPVEPYPGSGDTVNAAGYSLSADDFGVEGMASVRLLMPLDDLGRSTMAHPGGQSGHPGHRFYDSYWNLWTRGQTDVVWGDRRPVGPVLTLTPR